MAQTTRRDFALKGLTAGLAAALLAPLARAAPAGIPVDLNDPRAKGLGFIMDAKNVDAASNPTFKAGQTCANCGQYQTKGAAQAACNVLGGQIVPAGGWCRVWVQRPTA